MTKIALARPVLIFILVISAILIGTLSFKGMRKENNPEVNFGTITVQTTYPGAGPDDINQLITRKVEEAVSGVSGIREVQGISQEGVSAVVITLELGVTTDVALNDVRTKVDGIVNGLPKDALKPTVSKFDNSAQPILNLAVSSPTLSSKQLRDLIDDKIVDKFSQVGGVATVNVSGGDIREVQIRLKKDKLLQYGVGVSEVLQAVQYANANVPSGKYVSGGRDISVRVKSDFISIDQIKKIVVKVPDPNNPNNKAKLVPITEVADVEDTVSERTRIARLNGDDTVALAVQKTKEGNTLDVNTAIKAMMPALEKQFPIKFKTQYDESILVDESLNDVTFSLVFGIILVALIVFIFLHDFRGTLIVALAIPTCLFAAFIAMKAVGFTVNSLSMLGMSLAIGVLVDDAIVVLENIFRHLKLGEDPREAAINGRNEIGTAALAITLADVVVFLPVGFAGGIAGQFFKPLAITYVFAVLTSLFVSFTLTPLLASRWFRRGEDVEHNQGRFATWFEKRFAKFEQGYRRILEWALNHRWFTFVAGNTVLISVFMLIAGGGVGLGPKVDILAAIGVGLGPTKFYIVLGVIATIFNLIFFRRFTLRPIWGGALFGLVFPVAAVVGMFYGHWKQEPLFKFGFLPPTDAVQVRASIELPVGSSLSQTDAVARTVEGVFVKHPDIQFTLTEVGKQSGSSFGGDVASPNFAQVTGKLWEKRSILDRLLMNKEKLRDSKGNTIVADLTKAVGKIPGADVRIAGVSGFAFGRAIQIALRSDNRELLTKTATDIRDRLASGAVAGILNPDISVKSGKPELQIKPDYRKAADMNMDAASVGAAVRTLYQGNDDNKLRINGREYGVRVMLDYADRDNPETLNTVPLRFSQGNPVYVGQLATVSEEPGLTAINRRDRAEEIQVTADLLPGFSNGVVTAKVSEWIAKEKLVPTGVNIKMLGEQDAQQREMGFLLTAFAIGIFSVYAVLAALYNNWLYPMIIQLAQPQAMVGALLALILTDNSFSVIGFLGVIALVGLVGKNAILLVDFTNTLRERGRNRHDAIAEAGPTRLRPIMMTTLALICGTLPVAIGLGRGSEFRQSIFIIVLGGIILSTLLTLVVIPCSYTIFDDLSNLFARWMKKPMPFGGPDGFNPGKTTPSLDEPSASVEAAH
jgi:HAE1 family hydrophobic/amphiphilic exporter-1